MRKLKFRAYNIRTKEVVMIDDLYWFEENFVHNNGDNDWIIQEFTGEYDCDGVEVYEGDILSPQKNFNELQDRFLVQYTQAYSCKTFCVVQIIDSDGCHISEKDQHVCLSSFYGGVPWWMKIVGNVLDKPPAH